MAKKERAYQYTSVNVHIDQHAQLKRIAAFKNAGITEIGVEMARQYIDSFMEKNGDLLAQMEELEQRMAQLRGAYKKRQE